MSGELKLQGSFTSGELSPSLTARVDLAKFGQGCKTLKNIVVQPHGGAVKRSGFMLIDELPAEAVLIPFIFNSDQTYVLALGQKWMQVATADGFIMKPKGEGEENLPDERLTIESPYTLEQVKRLAHTQSADVLFMVCAGVRPHKLKRLAHDDWQFEAMDFTAPIEAPVWDEKTVTDNWFEYPLAYKSGMAYYPRSHGEYITYSPIKEDLYRQVAKSRTYTVPAISFINEAKKSDGSHSAAQLVTNYSYYVTTVNKDGAESMASDPASITGPASNNWQAGDYIILRWKAVKGAEEYRVYKSEFGGRPGFIGTAGKSLTFQDRNNAPTISDGPPKWEDPFPDDDYPTAVGFFEQRLVFASSPKRPQTLWLSRSGDYGNFSKSTPLKADDAIELTIASNEVSALCWMVALRSLVLGFSGMEWEIGSTEGAFSAKTAKATPQSYRGSSTIKALVIDNTILHVTRSGKEIRDFKYDFGSDSYAGVDRTILAQHLFEGRHIVGWTYQATPDSIIWVVLDDGTLLGMTYQNEHDVFAWHQHETDGAFLSVCSIPHKHDDVLFAVTKRGKAFYLEKMAPRYYAGRGDGDDDGDEGDVTEQVFLDCALQYKGEPVSELSGLGHLEGKTVGILADGAVKPSQVVKGGKVYLPEPSFVVTVGLPYVSDLETMPVEVIGQFGTSVGRKKYINAVNVLFKDTVVAKVGCRFDRLEEYKARSTEQYNQNIAPFTGIKRVVVREHAENMVTVCVRSDVPLPMTVLAIMPEMEVR